MRSLHSQFILHFNCLSLDKTVALLLCIYYRCTFLPFKLLNVSNYPQALAMFTNSCRRLPVSLVS